MFERLSAVGSHKQVSSQMLLNSPALAHLLAGSQQLFSTEKLLQQVKQESLCFRYVAPSSLQMPISQCWTPALHLGMIWKCPICRGHDQSTAVHLIECGHVFHLGCLQDVFTGYQACPSCKKSVFPPQGDMPSESMTIYLSDVACEGYEKCGTIIIDYCIPTATQKPYHANPGQHHCRLERRAFVPANTQGANLVKRLRFAFMHGLTFTVDDNAVTWALIPHKTSLSGGPDSFGFPDQMYITNCNKHLDMFEVPHADDL
jgi:Deltex C-terminal domain/Ring finger domain